MDRLPRLLESVVTAAADAVLITEAGPIDEADGGPRIALARLAEGSRHGAPAPGGA